MLILNNNIITYNHSLCQQCGICKAICPQNAISFVNQTNGLNSITIDINKCILCQKCVKVCPSNKESSFEDYFKNFPFKKYYLAYNNNSQIRRESSSGGVCKTLIIEGLKTGYIDGVYSLKKTDTYPYVEGEFYTRDNIPQYNDIPNSVYHSVMLCTEINKIKECNRLMIVGTSCQLRALTKVVKYKCKELISVCIFCKQQKTLDSTRFLAKIMETKIPESLKFTASYRGNGWPGIVKINKAKLSWNRAAQLPFGRRLWTVPGCDICGDSFGLEAGADISLMDPWTIRPENEWGETLIIVHSEKGFELLKNIPNLILEEKSFKEVEPALSLKDVWRKQQLVPFFRGETTEDKLVKAGKAEIKQRRLLQHIAEKMPRMPILFYRILCKFPDFRNKILN